MNKLFIIFITVVFFSCGPDWKADVKSDTTWSGSFGNRTVDGSGNQIVNLPDDDIVCCVVQKDTRGGYLEVKIVDKGGSIFSTDGEKAKTTAEYGVVSVCTK